jgi:hypothetical protein
MNYFLNCKNKDFCNREQIICSSIALRVFSGLIGIIPSSRKSEQMKEEISSSFLTKLKKKMVVTMSKNLTIFGRINDSIPHLQDAIDLGYLPAIADLALVCFTANHPHQICKHAFELLKRGHEYGCPDCTGMLAFYYMTGCRGVTFRNNDYPYFYACQSAATGSWFGKMALVHFLNSLLGVQDPEEEKFWITWIDPFICNFDPKAAPKAAPDAAPKAAPDAAADADYWDDTPFQDWSESDFEDWFEDPDILSQLDIRRIARILIEEIQQEHLRNPDMPKVWSNLPVLK